MRPFFFGRSEKPLFGVHHPAFTGDGFRKDAVVLCSPFGTESIRAHRAFRELANLLAMKGFHVLRFDYFGIGDSAGDSHDATVEQWLDDIEVAIEESKEAAGLRHVSIVGLRFGAALAAIACQGRDDVTSLALWDPVASGQHYMHELAARHHAFVAARPHPPTYRRANPPSEVLGMPLTESLRRGVEGVNLLEIGNLAARRTAVFTNGDEPGAQALAECLRHKGAVVDFMHLAGPKAWLKEAEIDRSYVPRSSLVAIAEWLAR